MIFFSSFAKLLCCKTNNTVPSVPPAKKLKFYDEFITNRRISTVSIVDINKIEKPPFGELEIYTLKVLTDDYEFFIEKKFQDFINFKEDFMKKMAISIVIEIPVKQINFKLDQEMIELRQQKLNSFLSNIVQIFQEASMIEIFDFLEIYENYEKKEVFLESSFNLRKLKSFYLAKDDAQLIDLMVKLNTSPNHRIHYFNKIKEVLIDLQANISTPIKEILLNGFYELQGLVEICGQYTSEPHIVCCAGLNLLYTLCDYEKNKEAEIYINLFSKLSAKDFSKLNLGAHIVQIPAKNCKKLALKLLEFYKEANPQANTFLLSQILNNDDAYNEFEKWKSGSTIISQKTEFFEVDVEECKISTLSLMINNMNMVKSEGQKKVRSNMYRKRKKDKILIPVRNQSN